MPDTEITTKPFVSRAQAGWAFATGQPWARRWARETGSYKKLPKRKRLKAVCTCTKETLAPGVTRIRGNLCNVHGRWGACDKAGQSNSQRVAPKQLPKAPKPKAGGRGKRSAGGKGRAAAKPKRTPEQRRAETEAAHAQKLSENRQEVTDAMAAADAGLSPSGSKALLDFADGKPLDSATADGLAKMGLVEIGKDGQPRLSQAGRATVAAMNRGDVRGALDAIGRGSDRVAQQAEAERKRQEREAEKKKKGKGGGGKGKKPPQPRAPLLPRGSSGTSRVPQAPRAGSARAANPSTAQPQISPEVQRAVQALSEGKPLDEATTDLLIRNGLARRNRDGELYLTAAGQRALRSQTTTKASSPGDYLVVEDPAKSSTWHLQVKRNGKPDHRLMGAAWAALHGGYRGNRYEGPGKAGALTKLKRLYEAEKMPLPAEKSFAVFKDASGAHRWIARTTTAFEDHDQEVISTKALEESADSPAPRGPLRWWHMGRPDPLSSERPWGPGVDLGWCDFAAISGRTLIESGTFKSAAIANAVAAHAQDLELSPGFFHAAGEPDASGVFSHIRIFERSLVPKWAGRASNPYTGLVVEKTMDQRKVQALKELGASDEVVSALLADVQTTEKGAIDDGVRYKESHPVVDFFRALFTGESVATKEEASATPEPAAEPPATADVGEMAALKAQIEVLTAEVAALKAGPPAEVVETQADGKMPMEDMPTEDPAPDEGGGLTLSTDDLDAIGQVFGAVLQGALEPLVGALGITQKLEGHLGELKTMMGGYVKQKDGSAAQQAQELAELKDQITELVGDASRGGYRPTQASNNTLAHLVATAMKNDDDPAAPTPDAPFADIAAKLIPGLAQQ